MTTAKHGNDPILEALKALESSIQKKIDEQNAQIVSMKNQQGEIHEAIVGSLDGSRRGLLRRVEQLEYVVGIFVSGVVILGGLVATYVKGLVSGGKS